MPDNITEQSMHSEIVYQGRLLTIRKETSRLPNGVISQREVIVHPGAVAMVPLLDNGHILLVRQWRTAAASVLLEIPAGTRKPGEDCTVCAERELMEEIGYRPRKLTSLCSVFLAPGYSSEKLEIFLAEDLIQASLPQDEDENIDVVSVTWEEVNNMISRGQIADSKSLNGLLLAQRLLLQR